MVKLYQETIAGPGIEPAHRTGAQIPYALANESHAGMAAGGRWLANQGEQWMGEWQEAKANNEISEFEGNVAKHQGDFNTWVANNPNASMEDMKTAQQTMMTRIAGEGQNMSTKKSNQFAQNWHLSQGAGIKASSDVSMAKIGYRNEYNKAIAGIAAATESNDYESVVRQAERASGQSDFNVRYQPTKLDATQEADFQKSFAAYSGASGGKINADPDDPLHFYDYRGQWQEQGGGAITPDAEGHLSSKWKLAGHPNTFVGGIHTPSGKQYKGGVLSVEQANYLIAKARTKASKARVTQIANEGLTESIDLALAGDMEASDAIIKRTHTADQVEGAMDDRDAAVERQEKRNTGKSQVIADDQLQLIRDDALGILPENAEPVTMHTLNKLLKKERETPGTGITEDQYQELVKALNGEGTAFDVSNQRVKRKVLDQISAGTISSEQIRMLHGKGLSTDDVETLGKQADTRLKTGPLKGMDKQIQSDLETLKKSGYFIWGADEDWPEMFGDEEKVAEMSMDDRMQNLETFTAIETNLNQWRMDNPNASDAERTAYYDRLVDPAKVHVNIEAGGRSTFWNFGSDEAEIRRKLQWENLRKTGEALAEDMDAAAAGKEGSKSSEELKQTKDEIVKRYSDKKRKAWEEFEAAGGSWQRWQKQDSLVNRGL